jgi:hypothetical protein
MEHTLLLETNGVAGVTLDISEKKSNSKITIVSAEHEFSRTHLNVSWDI